MACQGVLCLFYMCRLCPELCYEAAHLPFPSPHPLFQLEGWAATLEARRRRGECKVDKRGIVQDRESRQLLVHITSTTRPVEMDEAEQKVRRGL